MIHTRRQFLRATLSTPIAITLGQPSRRISALREAGRGWVRFEKPEIIRYDSNCFTLHNQDTFLFGAEFHYPRCPRELWRDRFLKLSRAGFNTVETMVFWNYHERDKGHFDFADLEEFLELGHKLGFWVIVRPGPYICAEFERAGFPRWVIAEHFPLRSMHPESLRTSKYWYDRVLPVLVRNQITTGGPIILMQLENEYDFCHLPDAEKQDYIRFLANLAWDAGVNVPLFTNWTHVVRDSSDPDMDRIMDTGDFYPGWNFMKEIPPALEKLRKEQPSAPLGITELQGGWFAQIGGRLSIDQEGVDGAQLNALTKSVLEMGVTYFNYYMGYGGTNFDWAAKTLTTTYDYAAPIREPGGLWGKYYAAHGIGEFLRMFGPLLLRAVPSQLDCKCTNSDVSVSERTTEGSAILFMRANTEGEHHFKATFPDPLGPADRAFTIPREGELVLGAREMKALPVRVPVAGMQLLYTTAEVLSQGPQGDRHFLAVYDEPGRLAEISLGAPREPQVKGQTLYQYWDQQTRSIVIGLRVSEEPNFVWINERLLLMVLPTSLALHTWVERIGADVIPGSKQDAIPFITDAYLLPDSGGETGKLWADLEFLPGKHLLHVLLPSRPSICRVGEVEHNLDYDPEFRAARVEITTPSLPVPSVDLREIQCSVESFDPHSGEWTTAAARPLEQLSPVPYGYVKYRGQLNYNKEPKLYIATFADDGKRVFVNGKDVPEAANSATFTALDASPYLKPGNNTVEVSCEIFGAPNFGDALGEFKGVKFVRVGCDPETGSSVEAWQIQAFPAAMHGSEVDPDHAFGSWQAAALDNELGPREFVPAFTWCRAQFNLPITPKGWSIPWRLIIDADRDALIYLNGRFVGRYPVVGPQCEFYLPEPYFRPVGREDILTVVLAYTNQPGALKTLCLAPYEEYSTQRVRIGFEW